MTAWLTTQLLFLTSVLWHASDTSQDTALAQRARRTPRLARLLACALATTAAVHWSRQEAGPAAGFVVLAGLMVMGAFVTLLAPLAPRLLQSLAALAAIGCVLVGVLELTR